jgi:hypothetical protein
MQPFQVHLCISASLVRVFRCTQKFPCCVMWNSGSLGLVTFTHAVTSHTQSPIAQTKRACDCAYFCWLVHL